MKSRKIEIRMMESEVKAVATLLEKEAPETCKAMWVCLEEPMETEGIQAMWVGPEVMFIMPEKNQKVDVSSLPKENATSYPMPGDVIFQYYPSHIEQHPFGALQKDQPIWDFFFIYGPDAITGGSAYSVFARITDGLDALAKECRKIRENGTMLFRVSRLE